MKDFVSIYTRINLVFKT